MAGTYVVRVQGPSGPPLVHELGAPRALIGRERGDLVVPDARCSSTHAEIVFDGRTVRVIDRASTNGTLVNGQRVDELAWTPGVTLQIGAHTLTLLEIRSAGLSRGRTVAGNVPLDGLAGAQAHGSAPTVGVAPGFGSAPTVSHAPGFGNAPAVSHAPGFGNAPTVAQPPGAPLPGTARRRPTAQPPTLGTVRRKATEPPRRTAPRARAASATRRRPRRSAARRGSSRSRSCCSAPAASPAARSTSARRRRRRRRPTRPRSPSRAKRA